MFFDKVSFSEINACYQERLNILFNFNHSSESNNKLEELINGLSSVNTVKDIRDVANNLKGEE